MSQRLFLFRKLLPLVIIAVAILVAPVLARKTNNVFFIWNAPAVDVPGAPHSISYHPANKITHIHSARITIKSKPREFKGSCRFYAIHNGQTLLFQVKHHQNAVGLKVGCSYMVDYIHWNYGGIELLSAVHGEVK